MKIKHLLISLLCLSVLFASCNQETAKPEEAVNPVIQEKVDAFALFKLTTDLSSLTKNEKKMLPILIEVAE
ncbi:MAG: Zn-dependent hydrolase, partial [Bacteroidetes bacterium]|nr:Zn-dependent hydrolase [Bacteroidota bacterium]